MRMSQPTTPFRRLQGTATTAATVATAVLGALAFAASGVAAAADACSVRSGHTAVPVVELYTSEGCNSCPPADRWLSRLKAEPDVVALAFHVDYWDRLGWKDRFASGEYTRRQSQQQAVNGARFSYTPQVVVDGADRKDWPGIALPLATRREAPVEITLAGEGTKVSATVAARTGAPRRLAAYWALTEQSHVTAVQAGENAGETLKHDYVVRDYRPVEAWTADAAAPHALAYEPPGAADPQHPRQVNLVVVDAVSGRPLQAVKAGC
jgi:hypothetical protein